MTTFFERSFIGMDVPKSLSQSGGAPLDLESSPSLRRFARSFEGLPPASKKTSHTDQAFVLTPQYEAFALRNFT